MATILMLFNTLSEAYERLSEKHTLIRPPKGRDFTREEIRQLASSADVLCSVFDMPVDADLLGHAPNVKLVANYAVGYNNIDLEYCKQHGIVVTNLPHSVVIPTAELTMALLLSCSRRIAELNNEMRKNNGRVALGRLGLMGLDLYGKTIGIIGYGNIGAAVAERCRAFGMKILYYKRNRLPEALEHERGIEYADFEDLLQRSDFVSVHTPYSKESHHQIDARALSLMKPGSILLNTARGSVVDEDALIKALEDGYLASAGLDVFEDRDIPREGLLRLPQVVLTPHVGTQTYDARVDMNRELVDNVLRFLEGRTDISRVI